MEDVEGMQLLLKIGLIYLTNGPIDQVELDGDVIALSAFLLALLVLQPARAVDLHAPLK